MNRDGEGGVPCITLAVGWWWGLEAQPLLHCAETDRLYTGSLRNSDFRPRCNESSRKANNQSAKVSRFRKSGRNTTTELRRDRINMCMRSGDLTEADGDRGREIEGYSPLHTPHGGFDAPHSWKVSRSQVSAERHSFRRCGTPRPGSKFGVSNEKNGVRSPGLLSVRDLRVADCDLTCGDIPAKKEGNHIGARKLRNHEPGVPEMSGENSGDERWV